MIDVSNPNAQPLEAAPGWTLTVETFGGNCPVQAEGEVTDGVTTWVWYFRARGDGWTLEVGARLDEFGLVPEGEELLQARGTYGPWPDAGRVLALLVDYPGELDTASIAAHLWPPPRRDRPYRDAADLTAWARQREEHQRTRAAKVSRLLEGLRRLGLVEPRRGPQIAAWYVGTEMQRGRELALAFAVADRVPRPKVRARHIALVARLASTGSAPPSAADMGTSRAVRTAYADLVSWGVVVPPSHRWPSVAGLRLVDSWGAR